MAITDTVSGAAGSAKASITGTAGKATGGVAGVLGISDYAEGNGFDMARAAGAEAVNGINRARQMAGDTLRDIFGGLPWEMGGDTAEAAQGVVSVGMDVVLSVM